MEISVSLPLDEGFLRRECPSCERQFKWFNGDADNKPEDAEAVEQYFCPYCGKPAATDSWWTPEQLEYVQGVGLNAVARRVRDELGDSMNALKKTGFLSVSLEGGDASDPAPITEPQDMVIVEPPCHYYEPIKIAEDWTEPIYCIVCGREYVI